jgi:hypothetical protein
MPSHPHEEAASRFEFLLMGLARQMKVTRQIFCLGATLLMHATTKQYLFGIFQRSVNIRLRELMLEIDVLAESWVPTMSFPQNASTAPQVTQRILMKRGGNGQKPTIHAHSHLSF